MKYLSESLKIVREWITKLISGTEQPYRGLHQEQTMSEPTEPSEPPWRCAGIVDQLGEVTTQIQSLITQAQVLAEELRICQDSTQPLGTRGLRTSEVRGSLGFIGEHAKSLQWSLIRLKLDQ